MFRNSILFKWINPLPYKPALTLGIEKACPMMFHNSVKFPLRNNKRALTVLEKKISRDLKTGTSRDCNAWVVSGVKQKKDDIITTAKVNDINIDIRLVPICEEGNWALGNSIFKKQFLQPNHKQLSLSSLTRFLHTLHHQCLQSDAEH